MDYSEYYKARDIINNILREDLLGPVFDDEVLEESPVSYYLVGKLYPRNIKAIDEADQKIIQDDNVFEEENSVVLGSGNYPSAAGFTFAISKGSKSFDICLKYAKYNPVASTEDGRKTKWERKVFFFNETIIITELLANKIKISVEENLEIHVSSYIKDNVDDIKITVSIVNIGTSEGASYKNLSANTYFQPELKVSNLVGGYYCEVLMARDNIISDDEMELLYYEENVYATGHGCAVSTKIDGNIDDYIQLEIVPSFSVRQMMPALIECGNMFSMEYLATTDYLKITQDIDSFCKQYELWINEQERLIDNLKSRMHNIAFENIKKCRDVLKRLETAKELLLDELVFRAFKYANQTMCEQRVHTNPGLDAREAKWYPFQLAFFLQEIESIVRPESEDRKKVDLLWFPTGGGKTEAYLGISAFTIFYRRLLSIYEKKEDRGTSVIMRYTLRLLSLQQFERAASMICAAEKIRKENNISGHSFGIGLWAGQSLTPNYLKDAKDYLSGIKQRIPCNPVQLKKCPWCGSRISENDYSVDTQETRMHIKCNNSNCDFNNGLPVYLVDEEIYEHKPSFVIGTVDKFAQIAFNNKAGELLGVDLDKAVDLIIQDELHLIAGPLGTIAGAYEAAFAKLMEKNGVMPKVIASTATIKNAKEQIRNLYAKDYAQFPPQGITIKDSFFAKEADSSNKADRQYLGVIAPGISRATSFNRVVGALLFGSRYLKECGFSDDVIDSFWTQTDYFNNLKELGSALTRIVDNVQDRYKYLAQSKFKDKYKINGTLQRYDRTYEMTSRNSSSDLGEAIQNQLKIKYSSTNNTYPYDFLVASNMISVGVDVPRLNTMVVVGQPIKSSEYIQSTSRVGRSTPGFVVTVYSPTKSRDRSHYEQFTQYHSTLYKYVEPTSVTPFSDRARDRTLQAIYVILCRYLVPELRANEDAINFDRNNPKLDVIRNYIIDYVSIVDSNEVENVKKELDDIEIDWTEKIRANSDLVYHSYSDKVNMLFDKDYEEDKRFRMMGSMRNVEHEIYVATSE